MTSKEAIWVLLEEIKLKRGCDKWYKCVEAKNIIEKDLKDYEELKNLMGTPIQAIRKDLKLLEEIRNCVLTFDEFSGVPASLVLKKIRELIFDGK